MQLISKMNTKVSAVITAGGLLAGLLAPSVAQACACGCGVFDVATSSMFPNGKGGMAFLQYDYQDQNHNWSGSSRAPADDNDDKRIETHFISLGLQYLVNRSWGVRVEVPYDERYFKAVDDATGNVTSRHWSQFGDVRVEGIYTGFFDDLSAGLTFGLKLPTGSYTFDSDFVDRDTQIGTGSTDLLFGGFYRGNLSADWNWFTQFKLDLPVASQDQYRPGIELDAAAGVAYHGFSIGNVKISPIAQVIFSERTSDSGDNANPDNSGYQRILLAPGVEFHIHPVKIYADAEFPVYQNFTGNQLAAPVLFKVMLSYMF
jgi:hypothetical protein